MSHHHDHDDHVETHMVGRLHKTLHKTVLPFVDSILAVLVLVLMVALFATIVIKMYQLFSVAILSGGFEGIINDILFVLILIELMVILAGYVKNHTFKVERVIEVGIISLVRESIFHIFHLEPSKILAMSVLLLVFGALFWLEKKFSYVTNGKHEH